MHRIMPGYCVKKYVHEQSKVRLLIGCNQVDTSCSEVMSPLDTVFIVVFMTICMVGTSIYAIS